MCCWLLQASASLAPAVQRASSQNPVAGTRQQSEGQPQAGVFGVVQTHADLHFCLLRWLQALVSAQSLDQVHSATQAFFATMCSFCNLNPAAATAAGSKHGAPSTQQATKRHSLISGVRKQLEDCMDAALAAAAAAGRVHAARQKLSELQVGKRR